MNQQVNAYSAHQQVNIDSREVDKRALLSCASRLEEAKKDGGKDMKKYQDAVRHNQHLWTMFQVAIADPASPMNHNLKLTLLRLSGYVDKVSFRIITEFMPEKLDSLININKIIAAGLAKSQAQSPAMTAHTQLPVSQSAEPVAVRIST